MNTAERLPLSRGRIIAAAITLVDHEGLPALSMRKLGAVLGVEAMSLYNHIENKDDVLDGMCDQVMREIQLPDPEAAWGLRLRALALEVRRVGISHPGVLPLLGARPVLTPEGFAPVAALHQAVVDAGFASERDLHAFVFVAAFVLGYLRIDQGRLDRSGSPYDSWSGSQDETVAGLGRRLVVRNWDAEFDRCLDLVIESLVVLGGPQPAERPGPRRVEPTRGAGGRSRTGR